MVGVVGVVGVVCRQVGVVGGWWQRNECRGHSLLVCGSVSLRLDLSISLLQHGGNTGKTRGKADASLNDGNGNKVVNVVGDVDTIEVDIYTSLGPVDGKTEQTHLLLAGQQPDLAGAGGGIVTAEPAPLRHGRGHGLLLRPRADIAGRIVTIVIRRPRFT